MKPWKSCDRKKNVLNFTNAAELQKTFLLIYIKEIPCFFAVVILFIIKKIDFTFTVVSHYAFAIRIHVKFDVSKKDEKLAHMI